MRETVVGLSGKITACCAQKGGLTTQQQDWFCVPEPTVLMEQHLMIRYASKDGRPNTEGQ